MAHYKCGYCGTYNQDDIWCSELHRAMWYHQRKVEAMARLMDRSGRLGPQGRAIGGRDRIRKAQAKNT